MKLALSAPLPPWMTPTTPLAASLLAALQSGIPVHALVDTPWRLRPGLCANDRLHSLCDLPQLLAQGTVDVPIYLIGDDALHVHQLRYVRKVPGILVLPELRLEKLAACLRTKVGDRELPFVSGFDHRRDLAAQLAAVSRTVVVTSEADCHALKQLAPKAVVHVVPALSLTTPDAAVAARELRRVADTLLRRSEIVPDTEQWPSVTAVVIGYNSKDIVGPCLQTLLDQDYPNLEVVVVDNASKDGTAEFVATNFPQIKLIASDVNLGFAEGNNLVFQTTQSKYVVLLNQDAYAQRNWVAELVRAAEMDERIGSVGSKMLFNRCPTLLNSTAIEINEAGWGWDRQVGERDENPSPMPEEVFGGCGGAVLYRTEALRKVGGFDNAFFMYYEDTDLAWRLRLAGYDNLYAPLAVVRHDFHGDTGATPGRLYRRRFMSERNRWATLVKNLDRKSLLAVLPKIRKYDKGRIEWLEKAVKDGHNPEFHGQIAKIIRQAWTWNLLRLPQLLWRRFRTQRLVAVKATVGRRFLVAGINEGGHQGDVDNFHDRFSATHRTQIVMGETDLGSIGSGWHTLENPPSAKAAYRWCKGRAWFYLSPENDTKALYLRLASPIRHHAIKVYVEDQLLGTCTIDEHAGDYCFALPEGLPSAELLEFTIEAETITPKAAGLSTDIRDLGVIVFSMQCAKVVAPGVHAGKHFIGRGFDRNAAPKRAAIIMGESDDGVLGTGFFGLERPQPNGPAYRWCSGQAQAYVQPTATTRSLVCKAASPLRPHQLTLFAEARELGKVTVQGGVQEFRFDLPADVARDTLLEVTIESETTKPKDLNGSADVRELGLLVFELRAE
jgi:hypothetical protein